MKRCLPLMLALAAPLAAQQDDDEIPLGIEVLSGFRSEYVFRGFGLADQLLEFQLEAEIALSDRWLLNLGGWYGTATGSGDFEEVAGYLDFSYDAEHWRAGLRTTARAYQHARFDDGLDLGPFVDWFPHDDWRLGGALHYDDAAGGWYGEAEAEWSRPLGEQSFIAVLAGLGVSSDYSGSDGFHDIHARASYTYLINRHVAVTPWIGTSIGLDDQLSDHLYAGLWFEVIF